MVIDNDNLGNQHQGATYAAALAHPFDHDLIYVAGLQENAGMRWRCNGAELGGRMLDLVNT